MGSYKKIGLSNEMGLIDTPPFSVETYEKVFLGVPIFKHFTLNNQLLQLCTAHTVFLILVTVRLYTVMFEVCCWLTDEKQRKTDIR